MGYSGVYLQGLPCLFTRSIYRDVSGNLMGGCRVAWRATASIRLATSSLLRMLAAWALTVPGATTSWREISWLVLPRALKRKTYNSRWLNGSTRSRVGEAFSLAAASICGSASNWESKQRAQSRAGRRAQIPTNGGAPAAGRRRCDDRDTNAGRRPGAPRAAWYQTNLPAPRPGLPLRRRRGRDWRYHVSSPGS
jgi:hypothetical protein